MLQVTRKEDESVENMVRRFNKKVIQSGILTAARQKKYFQKPISKTEAREVAIRKRVRKEQKMREMLGQR
ncbi:MAG: 30S ribosomal protein S21 [Candidatus Saccharibacteria bacterium]|nr:30S ribosomal protein S21 [Patescibacteria group bacterium]